MMLLHFLQRILKTLPRTFSSAIEYLAEQASQALEMDYAGVDLMRDYEGNALVIEVNGIPAWKGLQSDSDVSIARCLINDLLDRRLACVQRAKG